MTAPMSRPTSLAPKTPGIITAHVAAGIPPLSDKEPNRINPAIHRKATTCRQTQESIIATFYADEDRLSNKPGLNNSIFREDVDQQPDERQLAFRYLSA